MIPDGGTPPVVEAASGEHRDLPIENNLAAARLDNSNSVLVDSERIELSKLGKPAKIRTVGG